MDLRRAIPRSRPQPTRFATALVAIVLLLWRGTQPASAAEPAPSDGNESRLNGRWRWHFAMPDGSTVSPQARLRYDGHVLSGTSRFRRGSEAAITNSRVQGNLVSFEVIRTGIDRQIVTRYSGTLQQDRLVGTIVSDWNGKSQTYSWEAKRLPDTLEGTWRWVNEVRERKLEFGVKLRAEGAKVHGRLTARKGSGAEIKEGHFEGGTVSFEVDRERDGEKFTSRFVGKLLGDFIRGKETIVTGQEEQTIEWLAIRQD